MILVGNPWWSSLLPLGAALAYVALAACGRLSRPDWTRLCLHLAWVLHGAVVVAGLLERPPRFGFGPALSVTAWMVLSVYVIESRHYPQLQSRVGLTLVGLAAVLVAWWFPGTAHPALLAHWLPLHWALGFAAYGLVAGAVIHAWLMQRAEHRMREGHPSDNGLPLLALERLTFRLVGLGFALLTATLVAGFAYNSLAEVTTPWDHKTVFTCVSWLVLGVLLWGRWRWGWRGRVAARMVYAGAGLLLLGYVGSRFVLEVLLQRA